jgi:hypothetical protein
MTNWATVSFSRGTALHAMNCLLPKTDISHPTFYFLRRNFQKINWNRTSERTCVLFVNFYHLTFTTGQQTEKHTPHKSCSCTYITLTYIIYVSSYDDSSAIILNISSSCYIPHIHTQFYTEWAWGYNPLLPSGWPFLGPFDHCMGTSPFKDYNEIIQCHCCLI